MQLFSQSWISKQMKTFLSTLLIDFSLYVARQTSSYNSYNASFDVMVAQACTQRKSWLSRISWYCWCVENDSVFHVNAFCRLLQQRNRISWWGVQMFWLIHKYKWTDFLSHPFGRESTLYNDYVRGEYTLNTDESVTFKSNLCCPDSVLFLRRKFSSRWILRVNIFNFLLSLEISSVEIVYFIWVMICIVFDIQRLLDLCLNYIIIIGSWPIFKYK